MSVSGYDFGYLVKLLTDTRLPEEEHDFFQILNLFFPAIYDVKYLMKSCKNLKVFLTGCAREEVASAASAEDRI